MPNRIIKDTIHTSEDVNRMSDFQFRLWVSLITYVDDYGRGDARPAIIKGSCFPLRERIAIKDIEAALKALAGIGCVSLYEVDGKPYLCFPTWGSHQQIRNKVSKFPAPLTLDINCNQLKSDDINCTRNPIQSESESESESNPNDSTAPEAAAVLTLTLNDKSEYPITQTDIDGWQELFPAVDVMQELREMKSWCNENPTKRKTRSGVRKFINTWLSKEQDRGGRSFTQQPKKGRTLLLDMINEGVFADD